MDYFGINKKVFLIFFFSLCLKFDTSTSMNYFRIGTILNNLFSIKEELDKYITSAEVHDKELWLQIKERVQHLEAFVYSIQDGI